MPSPRSLFQPPHLEILHGERHGPSDGEILALWRQGEDTRAIAGKFFVHESEIANRLTRIRTMGRGR